MEKLFTVVKVKVSSGSTYRTNVYRNAIPDTPERIQTFINYRRHQLVEMYQTDNDQKIWKDKHNARRFT